MDLASRTPLNLSYNQFFQLLFLSVLRFLSPEDANPIVLYRHDLRSLAQRCV